MKKYCDLLKKNAGKGISHFLLIKLLKKFSRQEINEFEKFINSPFYNNHKTLIRLFRTLKKYFPDFDNPKLNKEFLFNSVNKNKKYDDKLLRKYLSRLTGLVEEYLCIIQFRSEKSRKDLLLLNQLLNKNLTEIFIRKEKDIKKEFTLNKSVSAEKYLLKHDFAILSYNFHTDQNQANHFTDRLTDSYNNLLNYFLFEVSSILNQINVNMYSYKIHEENLVKQFVFNTEMTELIITELLKNLQNMDEERKLFLNLLLNDIRMNNADSGKAAYENLKKLVYDYSHMLSNNTLFFYIQRLNVYCIIEKSKGDTEMNKDLLSNYKLMLERNLFKHNDVSEMKLLDFLSIINCAVKCEEYDWMGNFIRDCNRYVHEELSKNLFNYGMAVLSFYKNDYNECLNYISKIKESSLAIKINIYILKAKTFYMLGYKDSASSLIDSFRHFISGNKHISDFHKKTLSNFLKYFKSVLNLNSVNGKSKINNLVSELKAMKDIREKKWLIDKCLELSKNT